MGDDTLGHNHGDVVFEKQKGGAESHLRASSWSPSSSFPSCLLTSCSRLVPWKPLPWPSKRTTMVLKLLTSTVAQSTRNCSDTICPPGVPSLSRAGIHI
ncbi:hypothetical protein EYF80_044901 [Liparis tanakae]|uniref:Uncharacterized protein n=1 Tax=Liparis tanakae TaxID=230148 RepID=A0A4Z2FUK0_9TELE|nr:hypothetical protein EYF80_044901 [Liparis tanakae]